MPNHIYGSRFRGFFSSVFSPLHLDPDSRLSKFSEVHKGLPDMWIMHVDETHFDLLIRKDSDLAKDGCIDEMGKDNKQEDKTKAKELNEGVENAPLGPGYMGWKVDDQEEDVPEEKEFNKKIVELKEGYDEMKKEFEKLKNDVSKNEKKQLSKS